MSKFFRIVSDPGINGKSDSDSTYRRWLMKRFNSTQGNPPTEWIKLRNDGETDKAKFPLECTDGLYTLRAVEAFLNAYDKYKGQPASQWLDLEPNAAGELDGVCA